MIPAIIFWLQLASGLEMDSFGDARLTYQASTVVIEASEGRESGLILKSMASEPVVIDYSFDTTNGDQILNLRLDVAGERHYSSISKSGKMSIYPSSDGNQALIYGREFGSASFTLNSIQSCRTSGFLCLKDGRVTPAVLLSGIGVPLAASGYGGANWKERNGQISFEGDPSREIGFALSVADQTNNPAGWLLTLTGDNANRLSVRRKAGGETTYSVLRAKGYVALPNEAGAEILFYNSGKGGGQFTIVDATPCSDAACRCVQLRDVQSRNTRLQQWQCILGGLLR